jgi:hypothetical protein
MNALQRNDMAADAVLANDNFLRSTTPDMSDRADVTPCYNREFMTELVPAILVALRLFWTTAASSPPEPTSSSS